MLSLRSCSHKWFCHLRPLSGWPYRLLRSCTTSLVSAGNCWRQAGNHNSHGIRTQVSFPMAACKYAWIASAIDVPFPGRSPKNRHAARPTNPVGVVAVSSEPNRMGFPSASRTWSPLKTMRPLYLCWDGWSSKCFTPHRVSNSAI